MMEGMISLFPSPDASQPSYYRALRASLGAGALGDALGYRLELLSWEQMQETYQVSNPADLLDCLLEEEGFLVSDDTQLTFASLDGLTEVLEWNNQGQGADELACLWLSYLRWYSGLGYPLPEQAPFSLARPLNGLDFMQRKRGPGAATLKALGSGQMQYVQKNLNPQALGTGALLRSAPFGYLPVADPSTVISLSIQAAALTHGHPEALASAAAYALLIRHLLGPRQSSGQPLAQAAQALSNWWTSPEADRLLPSERQQTGLYLAMASEGGLSLQELWEQRQQWGNLWLAPNCLGYALALALAAEAQISAAAGPLAQDFEGLWLSSLPFALALEGDSDSLGALLLSLLGAAYGADYLAPSPDSGGPDSPSPDSSSPVLGGPDLGDQQGTRQLARLLERLDAYPGLDLLVGQWGRQLGYQA